MNRICIGTIHIDTGSVVISDPSYLVSFDSHTQNLPDLLPPGCPDLNEMLNFRAPELPFSREACWVASCSLLRGGILGAQQGPADNPVGRAVAVATEGDGYVPVYLDLADTADPHAGEPGHPVFGLARIVIDLSGESEQTATAGEEIMCCMVTESDVRSLAGQYGVPVGVALTRARERSESIASKTEAFAHRLFSGAIRQTGSPDTRRQ